MVGSQIAVKLYLVDMKQSGIYFITNTINGKTYVGSSNHISRRWNMHKHDLRKNKHDNTHLQRAWNKYGENVFKFEIAELVNTDELLSVEQNYLNLAKLMKNLYYNGNYDAIKAGT